MKRRIAVAFMLALPLELANCFLLMPPLDVGYPPGTSWRVQFVGLQWVVLHWAGLQAINRIGGAGYGISGVPILLAGG